MNAATVIVFGALRSGTTMLRLMLDANPHLACTGEHDFLFDHLHRDRGTWKYDRARLLKDRIFAGSGLALHDDLDGLEALGDLVSQIGRQGSGLSVLMLHRNLQKALLTLPSSRIIHFVRDPRDVARSSIGMMWAGNVFFGVDHWLVTEREWERAGATLGDRALEVRYEELVRKPKAVLEAICMHAGVPYDDRMLSYSERTTYSSPDPTLAFQWKKRLPAREVQLIEQKAGGLLVARGYKPSNLPHVQISELERTNLWLQNKCSIWRRIVSVYGLIPILQRGIGRRLKMPGLEHVGQAKIDAIVRQRVK